MKRSTCDRFMPASPQACRYQSRMFCSSNQPACTSRSITAFRICSYNPWSLPVTVPHVLQLEPVGPHTENARWLYHPASLIVAGSEHEHGEAVQTGPWLIRQILLCRHALPL